MSRTRLQTAVLLAIVAALGTTGHAQAGDDLVSFDTGRPMGEVSVEKALIYAVRPAKLGFKVKSFFFCDETILGINKGQSYFFGRERSSSPTARSMGP